MGNSTVAEVTFRLIYKTWTCLYPIDMLTGLYNFCNSPVFYERYRAKTHCHRRYKTKLHTIEYLSGGFVRTVPNICSLVVGWSKKADLIWTDIHRFAAGVLNLKRWGHFNRCCGRYATWIIAKYRRQISFSVCFSVIWGKRGKYCMSLWMKLLALYVEPFQNVYEE